MEERFETPEGIVGTKSVSGGVVVQDRDHSPQKQLTPEEISAQTGMNERYVRDLIKVGYLQPVHFTETKEPKGGPEQEEMAVKSRAEGKAIFLETRTVPAEEMLDRFWNLPRGKKRLGDPRVHREVMNLNKGYPVDHKSDVMMVQGAMDVTGGRLSMEDSLKLRGKIMVSPEELEAIIDRKFQAMKESGWLSPEDAEQLRGEAKRKTRK